MIHEQPYMCHRIEQDVGNCMQLLRGWSMFNAFLLLSIGLEEDFKAWKDGFVKKVFPVLVGEVAMIQLTLASSVMGKDSSCECGGKRKKECCKEKASQQV